MSEMITFTVSKEEAGIRADLFLAEKLEGTTRSMVQKLIDGGNVLCGGEKASKNYKVRAGDVFSVEIPEPATLQAIPQEMPLDIFFEDEHLLVINKPKGMVVHPGAGNPDGTLVNGVLHHAGGSLSGIGGVARPGIVHRIDKDTSGLIVIAKTDIAHTGLAQQFAQHSVKRTYEAVAYYNVKNDEGVIDEPIGRSESVRVRMAVNYKNGKNAVTHYTVLERLNGFTHLECRLETGRTHQIRVHMASIGHPIAGDSVYGPKKCITSLQGQCLHAKTLGFVHPISGEEVFFTAPLPEYFEKFLAGKRF